MAKIEEASRKKDELDTEFKMQTMEALSSKMEHCEEKREAIISDLKEKLKVIFDLIKTRVDGRWKGGRKCNFKLTFFSVVLQVHADEIKRNKEMLEKQKIEERNALNDKLKTAANLRDENIKRILERLREHVS